MANILTPDELPPGAQACCNRCQTWFTIHKEVEPRADGELQFFACPHCGHRYEYAFVTTKGMQLREKLWQITQQLRQEPTEQLRESQTLARAAYQAEVHSPLPDR